MSFRSITLISILFSLTSIIGAQSVRASIESSEVFLGQPFEYRIIIEGTTEGDIPDLSSLRGVDVRYKGASTTMVSSFGTGGNSSSRTITHSWTLTPLNPGPLEIPSVSVIIDGKAYRTASGTVLVREPEPMEGFHLLMDTDKDSYWIGEPVILSIRWLFSSSVSSPVFNIPFINSGLFSVESQTPPPGNDVYRINIGGIEVLTMQSAEIYKGVQYSTLSFQLKLIPSRSGEYELGPLTLAFDRAERNGGFRSSYKSTVIPSNSLSVKVKALPEGTEENIILSRGPLKLIAEADPLKVHIGDPLTFKIAVEGAVDPEKVSLPPLRSYRALEDNFSIPDRRSPGTVDGERVLFSQTLRVRQEGVQSIPPLEIPYFDVEAGKRGVSQTPAVPLEVMETQVVTSSDLEMTGYERTPPEPAVDLLSGEGGLLHNFDRELMMKRSLSLRLLFLLALIPAILFGALFALGKRDSLLMMLKRIGDRGSDFEAFHKSLKGRDSKEVLEAIRSHLSVHCRMDAEAPTSEEIVNELLRRGNDMEICHGIGKVLGKLEKQLFSREGERGAAEEACDEYYALSRELK